MILELLNIKAFFSNIFLKSTLGIVALVGLILFSFYKPSENKTSKYNNELKNITSQWYNLFLEFESKDLDAYPPISAERLAKMGVGAYTIKTILPFENNNKNTLLALNYMYADFLKNYHSNFKSDITNKITQLEESTFKHLSQNQPLDASYCKSLAAFAVQNANQIVGQINTTPFLPQPVYEAFRFKSKNPVLPEWGNKKLVCTSRNDLNQSPPFSKSQNFEKSLYEEALSVYSQSLNLSKEDIWIAEFWSDDVRGLTFSPAGRWISIANQIIEKEYIESNALIELYLKLGLAMNDACIISWGEKYSYQLQRPSQFINQNIDANWKPLHDDPSFPAYPSGHSILGASCVKILENQFGTNYPFTDNSHQNRAEFEGRKRSYNNLKDMAIENAYSRVLMGVHFKTDCTEGLRLGKIIGEKVLAYPLKDLIQRNMIDTFSFRNSYSVQLEQ